VEELNFLKTNRTFRCYYRTLRDVNFYLKNDSDIDSNAIQTTNRVLTKLIFDCIQLDGTTFKDMDPQQFAREFQIFIPDFLAIIKNSGTNDVDFKVFSKLLDEVLGIANLRASALEKIPKALEEEKTEPNGLDSWDGMVEINIENANVHVDMDEITIEDVNVAVDQIEIVQKDEDEGDTENEDEIDQKDIKLLEVLSSNEDVESAISNERRRNETFIDVDESENILSSSANDDDSSDYRPNRRYRY
jgi:hypothetical protein